MDGLVQFLSDPNVAYLLLTLGTLGVLAELFHPGAVVPGVAGAVLVVLAFVGLGHLPFSWGGLALLALAAILFGLELHTTTNGVLGVGGLVAFVVGSFALYEAPRAGIAPVALSPWVVWFMTLIMAAFFMFVIQAVRRSRLAPITMGLEALQYRPAQVTSRLNPRGKVRIEGEIWTAELATQEGRLTAPVEIGQAVEIVGLEGVVLKVRPLSSGYEQWAGAGQG